MYLLYLAGDGHGVEQTADRKLRIHADRAAGCHLDVFDCGRLKIRDRHDDHVAAHRQLRNGVGPLVRGRHLPFEVGGDVYRFNGGVGDDRGLLIGHLPGNGSAIRLGVYRSGGSEEEGEGEGADPQRTRNEHSGSFRSGELWKPLVMAAILFFNGWAVK